MFGDLDYSTRDAAQICSSCGTALDPGAGFCTACGASQDPYFSEAPSDVHEAFAPTADGDLLTGVAVAPDPDRRRRRRPWLWIAVLGLASIAAGVAAALALTSHSHTTVVVRKVAGSGGTAVPARATGTYTSSSYTAQYPSGWTTSEDDVNQGSYNETKFVSPDGSETLLVDRTPGDNTDPLTSAEQVESQTQSSPGYQRLGMDPTTINGASAEEWTFALGSERRVDFFFNEGGEGFAVLGHGGDFNQALSDARKLANSIQPG